MEELRLATTDGRTYDDIHEDVIRLTNYYINLWYKNYPILKKFSCDEDEMATVIYHYLYLKTKDDGLSNLERHFNKACQTTDNVMSYISNLIRKSVRLNLACVARCFANKPNISSLDEAIYQEGENDILVSDVIPENKESLEDIAELSILLDSIKHKVYKEYYTINPFGEIRKLTSKDVLNWIISGFTIQEMCNKVFNKKDENIKYQAMNKIRKETISLARDVFYKES